MLGFIEHLEVLRLSSNAALKSRRRNRHVLLQRDWIDTQDCRQFVALSYTWKESEDEDKISGLYKVQTRDGSRYNKSKVRSTVFDRVFEYMRVEDVRYLWIDNHCIPQRQCKRDCDHEHCEAKREGLHSMDLVYQESEHPVALLGRRVKSEQALRLLAKIMSGELVEMDQITKRMQISKETTNVEVRRALELLFLITSDKWWTRAWVFQEKYRAGRWMTLLIHHTPGLNKLKREYEDHFGIVPGELSINCAHFSEEATRLCLAAKTLDLNENAVKHIQHILDAARKYTLTLAKSDSMTSAIIADLKKKDITVPRDILDILANCCQYRIRLGQESLRRENIDLLIFAQCLLNGEILDNGRRQEPPTGLSVDSLGDLFFRRFRPPRNRPSLTYNKSSRFLTILLDEAGVVTCGHFWELGEIIPTKHLSRPYLKHSKHRSYYLKQLKNVLTEMGADFLARKIKKSIDYDNVHPFRHSSGASIFTRRHIQTMVDEIVRAIHDGIPLRLGRLQHLRSTPPEYAALFVYDVDGQDQPLGQSDFVFTSLQENFKDNRPYDHNDLDKYVSLNVEQEGSWGYIPQLRIKQWMTGFCFFSNRDQDKRTVVFPWPKALASISV